MVWRPVTTFMVTIACVLFGWVAATRLPVELLPELSYPSITVRTDYADAAPLEVEELITRPVEELVGAVPGVLTVESVSREGQSEVVLDFQWGTRIDEVMAEVREKLDRARLPTAAERPVVLRYDPAQQPILRLVLVPGAAVESLAALRFSADRHVKRALEKLPGVAAVQLHGGDEEEVVVEVDPARAAALRIDFGEVVDALTADNVNRPGGAVTEQGERYLIRTMHEARSPEDLEDVIVRSADGANLRLRDVAQIRRQPVEREEIALFEGREAIELSVFREGDANTVAVAAAVTERMAALRLPDGQRVELLSNQADFIAAAIDEVRRNVLLGGALAVCVLLFFLRDLRSTVVIATAIPISLLATFVPLHMLGVSLNLMSLGGLALGVGMLVDNSIVVLEAIARRREAEPADDETASRRETAIAGTREIAAAVVASTLTTVAVFFPMAFVSGVAGQLVRDLALAVSFSLISSLLVSLTLVPVLASIGHDGGTLGDTVDAGTGPPRTLLAWLVVPLALAWRGCAWLVWGVARVMNRIASPLSRGYDALEAAYVPVLRATLRARVLVLLVSALLCGWSFVAQQDLGRALLPDVPRDEFYAQLRLPQGTALSRTLAVSRGLTQSLAGDSRVASVFASVGTLTQAGSAAGTVSGTHLAQIDIRLRHEDEAAMAQTAMELVNRLQVALNEPQANLRIGQPELFSFEAPLEVQVYSEDLALANAHAVRLTEALAGLDSLREPTPDDLTGRPEVRVHFDRERLARLGLTVSSAASAVRRAIEGEVAGQMHTTDQPLDIRVQVPRVDRSRVEDVRRIVVGVVNEVPVRLEAVADVEASSGPAQVRRIDGRRGLRILARVASADLGAVAEQVQAVLDAHADLQERVTAVVSGQAEAMSDSLRSLALTAALSLFLVYVVMASSFESFHHPLLIMFTVPLAAVGVVAAGWLSGAPVSVMTGMGAIVLAGIVVNNAIVMITAVNQRRGAGVPVAEALAAAGRSRVRPILMTTSTTVLGLLPMALGMGEGAALRQPLALTIIGGLSVGTLLTLFVIPCVYSLFPGAVRAVWRDLADPSRPDGRAVEHSD
ncbi:MAG: efflux RND transporter permease subunit [Myxococcales bacterium FL481]|nr:MAG: efflux RND transporter permease subunit [Myxococcales bacterium FL481]